MTHLENLIYRYLDGELTPEELDELHGAVRSSPEAEALLRRLSAMRNAARDTPALHLPSPALEARLFAELKAEGLGSVRPAPVAMPVPAVRSRTSRRRILVAAALVILLGLIGDGRLGDIGVTAPSVAPIGVAMTSETPRADFGSAVIVPQITITPARPESPRGSGSRIRRIPLSATQGAEPAIAENGSLPTGTDPTTATTVPNPPSHSDRRDLLSLDLKSTPAIDGGSEGNTTDRNQSENDRIAASRRDRHDIDEIFAPLPAPEAPGAGHSHFTLAAVSGMTYVDKGTGSVSSEHNIRFSAPVGGGHELSLIVGQAPSVRETRRDWVDARSKMPDPKKISATPMSAAEPLPRYEVDLHDEIWMGAGYNYSLAVDDRVTLLPGLRAGVGRAFVQVGLELPARYQVTRNVAVEFIATAARTIPHGNNQEAFTTEDAANSYFYLGESTPADFTSIGMQLGLRIGLD